MAKVSLKCPTSSLPATSLISSTDREIIDAAGMVTECCMKHHTLFKAQAVILDTSASEATSDCWTGTGNTMAFVDTGRPVALATALIPLAAAPALQSGSNGNNSSNGGTNGAGGNTTAAPVPAPAATASDAGKASLTMAVMAGVAMFHS
jgi:hypothetical protein